MVSCTKYACFLLVLVGTLSWLVAHLLDALDPNNVVGSTHIRTHDPPYPGGSLKHLHWFLMVSDTHVSKFYDPMRVPDLKRLIEEYIVTIKPEVTLLAGDITDGKEKGSGRSMQYLEEWQQYGRLLRETNISQKTVWLDLRGNHDGFNLPYLKHDQDLYGVYSLRGQQTPYSFSYTHRTVDDTYTFIGVDAVPDPGPKRPFNFFGIVSDDTMGLLRKFATESRTSNSTVWFGHYPTSMIVAPSDFRKLISSDGVYMCGHLHTLANIVWNMYTRHKAGNLELEIGDWKDNRIFRLFAFDHELFSFTDEQLGKWPIILITNPKNAKFNMPLHEPLGRMSKSTHIRILVFSPEPMELISVAIDSTFLGHARHVEGPLYVLLWQPQDFLSGIHEIKVTSKDSKGKSHTVTQPFVLDESTIELNYVGRFILRANIAAWGRALFFVTFFCLCLTMMAFRMCGLRLSLWVLPCCPGILAQWLQLWCWRMHLLCSSNCVFFPLLFYHLYLAVGPWFVGSVTDSHWGVVFTFGVYVNGSFIPGSLTYIYGFIMLWTFNIPMTLCFARAIDLQTKLLKTKRRLSLWLWFKIHWLFSVLIAWQIVGAFWQLYFTYGGLAFITGPTRTWSVPYMCVLCYLTYRASRTVCRQELKALGSPPVTRNADT